MQHLPVPTRLCLSAALLCAVLALPLTAQQVPDHAPDGGTRERVQSLDIPAIPNAPFSATVVTEWTHIMPDGSKRTTWNHRLVARDSSGRVFQERRYFSPDGQTQTTMISELDYLDPNRHQLFVCFPTRVCRLYAYNRSFAAPTQTTSLPPLVKLPNGTTIQREDLGRNTIEDIDVLGSREITTIAAGVIGNEKPQPIVKEFWYSPRLQINVVTKRFDPRVSSIQNFNVTQIDRSEPDPKLFEPSAGYRTLDMSQP
jgi:hypothetical protein